MKGLKLFIGYLRTRRAALLFFAAVGIVFGVCFALSGLPLSAVGYPALLCGVAGSVGLVCDFLRVRRRHLQLREIALNGGDAPALPAAASLCEADYQAVVRALQERTAALQAQSETRYRDRLADVTLWVHQIKTPITSMRLALQNEDTPLSRRLRGELRQIEQYVEMVLVLQRLDADANDYVFRTHALDGIVKQSISKFAGEFIDRRLRLDYTPIDATVVTDEKWLSFVVDQVLSNALKYTRSGGVRVWLEAPTTLCIADTGVGISPADLPRIFEKGYTGCNGRQDKRASGLGLYLCRCVCDRLGARITAESTLGRGTCVRIALEQYPLRAE